MSCEEGAAAQMGQKPSADSSAVLHTGMPCELLHNFDPHQPILVGGVAPSEEGTGFMQLRFKRHRWFPKIMKTRDPLIFSIGSFCASLSL
jgi:ribosome biogenesis protein BMS1